MEQFMGTINTWLEQIKKYISDGGLKALYTRNRRASYEEIIRKQMYQEFDTRFFKNSEIPAIFVTKTIEIVMRNERQRNYNDANDRLQIATNAASHLETLGYSYEAIAAGCQAKLDNESLRAVWLLRTPTEIERYKDCLHDPETRDNAVELARETPSNSC